MSAILKALKKLEDEKQYIDDRISLDKLEIHSEGMENPDTLREKLPKWSGKILLILTGVLFGGLIGKLL